MENSKKYAGLPSFLDGYDLIPIEWNGCRAYYGVLPVGLIVPNTGQIDGLPANPRTWTKDELERLKKSLQETPELMLARGVLAFPDVASENLAALGGNMRHAAAKSLKEKTVPTVVYPLDTPAEKLMEIVIKDNGSMGEWDVDALANEWDNGRLPDWGVPSWVMGGGAGDGQERKAGSRAAGNEDVSGEHTFDVRVEFGNAEEQIAFLAEMEEREIKASAI